MEMQKKQTRKLELKKKTISKLSQQSMNNAGDSWTTIYISGACMTDFTRVISTIRITG